MDDCGDNIQHLGVSGVGDVALIVKKDGIKQWRHHAFIDHLQIIGFLDVYIDKLEDLLLDSSETSDLWSLGCNVTCAQLAS